MLHALMAVVRPSPFDHLHLASPPTEPEALAVYALVGWAAWLVWAGNRKSGEGREESSSESSGTDSDSDPPVGGRSADIETAAGDKAGRDSRSRGKGKERKLTRAERRRRGHIDWIQ